MVATTSNIIISQIIGLVFDAKTETFSRIATKQGVNNERLNKLITDRSGNIWACTQGSGVYLMQYDSTGRETGVADRARMTRLRSRYLGSPQAVRYFGDASRAWDEGLRANDGGSTHLANQLRMPEVSRLLQMTLAEEQNADLLLDQIQRPLTSVLGRPSAIM